MRALLTVFALISFASLADAAVTYGGGNGETIDKAIEVLGASGEIEGVPSEYVWVAQHFPGCKRDAQSLTSNAGRDIDVLEFTCANQKRVFYFDITDFFGK